ncbi:hypothetical protein CAPTEDRAFT_110443 [Capitella teleta]|uniref:Mitochondrial inner membrane protease ATP23 n=1 Tax=Capitella teleta TaxID=283909 RepID=R7TP45_CAPTE|nr:hypothetical protein CAPTEDRAFT_110443 [Capitella teleta]|eukprot:ELT95678.1 hypothetical protein CAPTEDRAFT_110443 [Capitella teleta]
MSDKDGEKGKQDYGRDVEADDGYSFYPERKAETQKSSLFSSAFSTKARRNLTCMENVLWCSKNHPYVKLLMGALRSQGCPVDTRRHVSCEDCTSVVNGGYDPTNNQVVICQNNSVKQAHACSVLVHELIHMFDYCRAKVDFKNIEHLACTEIRAAMFTHCSIAASIAEGDISKLTPWKVDKKHADCVKKRAIKSILWVRDVDEAEAARVVDKVFDKCYGDMEPFGRIPRRKSNDMQRSFNEGYLYGYCNR